MSVCLSQAMFRPCCPWVAYRPTCFVMYSACRIYLHFPVLYLLLRSYRRDVVLAWVLAMALCVSACVCQKSVLYRKGFIEINSKGPLNCLLHVAKIHNTIRKHGLCNSTVSVRLFVCPFVCLSRSVQQTCCCGPATLVLIA